MPLLKQKEYDFMLDDNIDSRIPVYSDELFKQGIHFCAKFIGSLDVPRPQNRLEIVSAMRKIRYEFKTKGVKKRKILFKISAEGIFVYLRKKQNNIFKWASGMAKFSSLTDSIADSRQDVLREDKYMDLNMQDSFTSTKSFTNGLFSMNQSTNSVMSCVRPGNLLQHYPIYRIFYVSHDSQDLKIFSYIARDSKTSVFKCNVFKAYKKVQAMRIVRTVGQAFDVCHRLSQDKKDKSPEQKDSTSCDEEPIIEIDEKKKGKKREKSGNTSEDSALNSNSSSLLTQSKLETDSLIPDKTSKTNMELSLTKESTKKDEDQAFSWANDLEKELSLSHKTFKTTNEICNTLAISAQTPFGDKDHLKMNELYKSDTDWSLSESNISQKNNGVLDLLKRQLIIQESETRQALQQVHQLMLQLRLESTARAEGQTRVQELLVQNRQLIEGLNSMSNRLQRLESIAGNQYSKSNEQIDTSNSSKNGNFAPFMTNGEETSKRNIPQSATFSFGSSNTKDNLDLYKDDPFNILVSESIFDPNFFHFSNGKDKNEKKNTIKENGLHAFNSKARQQATSDTNSESGNSSFLHKSNPWHQEVLKNK